jgi:hypothetical protein
LILKSLFLIGSNRNARLDFDDIKVQTIPL